MRTEEDLIKIAKNMLARHPRVLEYNLYFFKEAVKTQEGIELTDEESTEVGKIIVDLSKQKCDLRYLGGVELAEFPLKKEKQK